MVSSKRRKASRRRKVGKRSMSLLRKNPRRRRKARRNAWFNDAKGHKKAARLGWTRRKSRKAKKVTGRKKTRKNPFRKKRASFKRTYRRSMARRRNPVYRRKYRKSVRRNPIFGLKKAFSREWLTKSFEIALGIGVGMFGMPVVYALAPAGMKKHRNFFGIVHVALGAILYTMAKSARVKSIGGIVAGTGVYDLIAANTQSFLGLPMLPISGNRLTAMIPGGGGAPVLTDNSQTSGLGLSYYGTNDAISADYQRLASDFSNDQSLTVGLGDDDNPFTCY